ncbi:hypothetical protein STAFG_0028 [Streptomyces afghaniensis 772]|uniref:Uncharacterized protein n=1 Tax=Streptomyces afghaniensis 772 TaxID=1283301 RepID=S4N024_9ACTN|nr:hypothetical protein STAFG_0028 [Streptomyces afghaniensis 772]
MYASAAAGVLHWRQEEPADPGAGRGGRRARAPGTLRAIATSAEHTTLFFTDVSGDLCAWRPGEKPVTLIASAGPGPVSAVR